MYFITAFNQISIDGQTKTLDVGFQRTFGYYDNFNYADEALKQNYCDMHEAIYHYAVIEKNKHRYSSNSRKTLVLQVR